VPNPLSHRLRTSLFYALRTAFRLTPMPQGTRDRLRERFLDTKGHWVPEGPKGQAPTGALPRRPYVRSDERAIGYVPYEKGELPDPLPAMLVAFYLPQFHTIPENDEWWGKGFTEWRNVTRALPQFEGHYQPKLPGDLGFYDLRNVEVMHEQARLAREYGISAFCFYFYWFGGKTLLETPLRNWLNDKTIDLQFCLCWANEKWTRTWDGRGHEILIDQRHSAEDDIAFIEHVSEYMRDLRYLRVDGKPVLIIYRPGLMLGILASVARWRTWCRENGIGEIHLVYAQSFDSAPPGDFALDAAVAFPPNQSRPDALTADITLINPAYAGTVLDWREMWASHFERQRSATYPLHMSVNPCWDNEARRSGAGRTFMHSAPRRYRDALVQTIGHGIKQGDRLVFVNAWNEWAEGAMLEPTSRYGFAYLRANRDALNTVDGNSVALKPHDWSDVILHVWYLDVFEEILQILLSQDNKWRLTITTPRELAERVSSILRTQNVEHRILVVENRGRDVLPFLIAANQLLSEGVDVVLKLHTKRSPHRHDGDQWRNDILGSLVKDANGNRLKAELQADPNLGLIAPAGHTQPMSYYWGANESRVRAMLHRVGVRSADLMRETFVSGSMFWVRLESLRPLLDADLSTSDFEDEQGQLDGTLAHAIERMFSLCIRDAGYTTAESRPLSETSSAYRFADRG
jgi:lipopolysaccharide biosynthesis protein